MEDRKNSGIRLLESFLCLASGSLWDEVFLGIGWGLTQSQGDGLEMSAESPQEGGKVRLLQG